MFRKTALVLIVVASVWLAGSSPAVAATGTAYPTFFSHTRAYIAKVLVLVTAVTDDIDYGLYYSAVSDMQALYSAAKAEVNWLNSHKPQACYKSLWGTARNAWTQLREAASSGTKALANGDYYALDDFQYHMGKSNSYVNRLTAMLKKTVCGYPAGSL